MKRRAGEAIRTRDAALARDRRTWQSARMAQPPIRNPSAGGFLIAAGVMGGAVIGFLFGQATIGLLIGAVVSIGASLAIWARERGRY